MKKSIYILLSTVVSMAFGSTSFAANTFPSSGNVGIGTTDPARELHVEGWALIGNENSGPSNFLSLEPQDGFHRAAFSQLRFYEWGPNKDIITINNGNVGIGTMDPARELHVEGWALIGNENSGPYNYLSFEPQDGFHRVAFNQLRFYQWGQDKDIITIDNGNVGIGTTSPTDLLSVNGTIRAKEIIVETGWADFVLEDGYKLRSLSEVENHIEEHGHLPDVPSASDVESEGLSVGEAQQIMMQKIEELTLYTIDQDKKIEAQREEMATQQKEIERLKASSRYGTKVPDAPVR